MSQKMVVIPYDRYVNLKNLTLDKNKPNEFDISKVNDIQETEQTNPITNNDNNLLNVEDIVEYMPKTYKHRCRLILHHMKQNCITWDSFGRLILGGDECLMDSHIVDLIRDVISTYKRPCTSEHSNDFKKLLVVTHCPRSILRKSDNETS